jgi:hypothetical protein
MVRQSDSYQKGRMRMKRSKIGIVLTAVLLCSVVSTGAFGSVNDNQVTSQKIKEADGTSGQDTNSGSGVKTGHIQDGAVTTSKVADGAVTDAKIGGTIAQGKVTGLEAALTGKSDITHNHDNLYQKKYATVIVVAKSGGDFADPLAALNSIADASAAKPYLVKIMPGVYEVPDNTMRAKSYVDIEGSGSAVTTIRSYNNSSQSYAGTIYYYNIQHSELRDITIEAEGLNNGNTAKPITVAGGGNPHFKDVRVVAKNGDNSGFSLNGNAQPVLNRVEIELEGRGTCLGIIARDSAPGFVANDVTISLLTADSVERDVVVLNNSSATIKNLKITGFYLPGRYHGIYCQGSVNLKIYDSIIPDLGGSGGSIWDSSIYIGGPSISVYGANLELGSAAYIEPGGTFKCVNCFDSDFNPIPNN